MKLKFKMKADILLYLESCAYGVWDGSLKASSHERLVNIYIRSEGGSRDFVRRNTRKLTNHLPEQIGFPLESEKKAPNYSILWERFYDRFVEYAGEKHE